jgi:hypothetical protein
MNTTPIVDRILDKAREEGIALTPGGQPLFARDAARMREIRTMDLRTPEERAIDDAIDAAHEASS